MTRHGDSPGQDRPEQDRPEQDDVFETPETVEVSAALRSLPDLAMPEDVWNRLATALSAEAASGVVPISAAPSVRRRRTWVPGAVAAGVAIVATGVLIPVLNTGGGTNVADGPRQASAGLSVEPVTLDMVPARYVVATGTDYSETDMPSQVSGLLDRVGMDSAAEFAGAVPLTDPVPMPKSGATPDMTTDLAALHDCIAALAGDRQLPPALVVDRATFGGGAAAVVVFLHDVKVDSSLGRATVDVVVVNPPCTESDRKAAKRMTVVVAGVAP